MLLRRLAPVLAGALVITLGPAPSAQADLPRPGDLDTKFAQDGTRRVVYHSGGDAANAVAAVGDKGVVVAGTAVQKSGSGATQNLVQLVRYSDSGLLDSEFGTAGRVTMDLWNNDASANDIVRQPVDDKLVVVGTATYPGRTPGFMVARFTTGKTNNGWADGPFGDVGRVYKQFSGNAEAFGVAIAPDRKIVAAGSVAKSGGRDFALLRLNENSSDDNSFGGTSTVTTDFGGDDVARAVAVQPDGKVIAVGTTGNTIAIARYQTNGALDPGFGTGGKALVKAGSGADEARGVVVQPDGRILVAGSTEQNGQKNFLVLRYLPNGALDGSFSGGMVVRNLSSLSDAATDLALQADGRILISGWADAATGRDFALTRLNTNGTVDGTFGAGGAVYTSFGAGNDVSNGMTLQPDGKPVLAGSSASPSPQAIAVARYSSDPPLAQVTSPGNRIKRKQFRSISGIVTGADITGAEVAVQRVNKRLLRRKKLCQWLSPGGFTTRSKAVQNKNRTWECRPPKYYDARWSLANGVGQWWIGVKRAKPGFYVIHVVGTSDTRDQDPATKKQVRVVR